MAQITIAGKTFEVSDKYSEGHTLTANEASTLNQTRRENIRNNFAESVKKHTGTDEELGTAFNAYVDAYEFGQRTGGGSRDPVETEALNIARETVRNAIRQQGKNISDYSAAQITDAARKQVEKNPAYREQARKRIAELQSVSGAQSDLLDDLGAPEPKNEPAAGEASTDAGAKRSKKSAE